MTTTPAQSGTGPQPGAVLADPPVRPPLVRPQEGRLLGGVAAGLAAHLGRPVQHVRAALALAALAGGLGVVLYVWLWALVPSAEVAPVSPVADVAPPPARPGVTPPARAAAARHLRGVVIGDVLLGALLLLVGLALLAGRLGYDVRPGLALPALVVTAGAVLAYTQLDEVERSRWVGRAGGTRAAVLRVAGGVTLVLVGVLLVVVQRTDYADAGRVLVSALAVLAGAGVVLAPWGVRLWRDLDAERAARVRDAERADIAAHLHDSVLQTLALIQRHSDDPAQVVRLARAQERDLRGWLYGPRAPVAGDTLAGQVRALAADVEDLHGVAVDVVVVGDRPADARTGALASALREAVVNAVRHAGAPVQVYVEAGPDGVEAFVRDRGPGFDLGRVPPDRLGVRESVIGRMERAGGTAVVRSAPDEGTEVRLALPDVAGLAPAAPAAVTASPTTPSPGQEVRP
jgi:signal transduction histidine kinase/phage shock protein PspC (stress-responsive transcriptional regulator)